VGWRFGVAAIFPIFKKKILTVWKGNFWQFEKEILTVWNGKFWQFEKENFDSLKRKFWQFENENFDSLKWEILTVWNGKFWQFGNHFYNSLTHPKNNKKWLNRLLQNTLNYIRVDHTKTNPGKTRKIFPHFHIFHQVKYKTNSVWENFSENSLTFPLYVLSVEGKNYSIFPISTV
jgi:hypothetical protein